MPLIVAGDEGCAGFRTAGTYDRRLGIT